MFIFRLIYNAVRTFFKSILKEVLSVPELKHVKLSKLSFGTSVRMLQLLNLTVEDAPSMEFARSLSQRYTAFSWRYQTEPRGTPRAFTHLQQELVKAGVQLAPGGYQLYDVHDQSDLLSVHLSDLHLTGTIDLVLAPHGIHEVSLLSNACVVVELKTSSAMARGVVSAEIDRQAYGELICSRILSRQPNVMVIVTDLVYVAKSYEFVYLPVTNILKIQATELCMDGMIRKIRDFLAHTSEPVPGFNVMRLPSSQPGGTLRAKDAGAVEFFNNLLPRAEAPEQLIELLSDEDETTRAAALRQTGLAGDWPLPPLLQESEINYGNMYT